jgi:hypothetical protein
MVHDLNVGSTYMINTVSQTVLVSTAKRLFHLNTQDVLRRAGCTRIRNKQVIREMNATFSDGRSLTGP